MNILLPPAGVYHLEFNPIERSAAILPAGDPQRSVAALGAEDGEDESEEQRAYHLHIQCHGIFKRTVHLSPRKEPVPFGPNYVEIPCGTGTAGSGESYFAKCSLVGYRAIWTNETRCGS